MDDGTLSRSSQVRFGEIESQSVLLKNRISRVSDKDDNWSIMEIRRDVLLVLKDGSREQITRLICFGFCEETEDEISSEKLDSTDLREISKSKLCLECSNK